MCPILSSAQKLSIKEKVSHFVLRSTPNDQADFLMQVTVCSLFLYWLLPSATKLRKLCFYTSLSVHGGWGQSASLHVGIHPQEQHTPYKADIPPPPRTDPPGADTPKEQTPPRSRHPSGAGTPPQQTATAADGPYPTGMHSCFNYKMKNIGARTP